MTAAYSPIVLIDIGLSSTKRVATRFYTYGAGYAYGPVLLNWPDVLDSMPDPDSGARNANSIVLRIAHGAAAIEDDWFEIMAAEELRGATISIEVRDDVAATSTFLASGTIDYARIGEIAELHVDLHQDAILDTVLPKRVVNSTLFTSTALDAGQTVPIVFGPAYDVPLRNIQEDTTNNYYDYLISEGVIEGINTASGRGVKRAGALAAAGDYTVYDGSQASPFAGFAFIRFILPQRDFSNQPISITADVLGLELGGATASNNMPTWLYNLLTNSTWGLGDSADATTFGSVTGNIPMGGALVEPRAARDIIRDWFAHEIDLRIERNVAGAWKIYKLSAGVSIATLGDADGFWNNCRVKAIWRTAASQTPRSIKGRGMRSWANGTYLAEAGPIGARDYGKGITRDFDFVSTAPGLANIIKHRWQRSVYDLFCEIEAGLEARALRRGDRITAICPRIAQLASGQDFIIDEIHRLPQVQTGSKTVPGFRLICREYSDSLYSYVVTCDYFTQTAPTTQSPGPYTASQFIDNTAFTTITDTGSPHAAVNGGRYKVNTSSAPVTLTLPASPAEGWRIFYLDRNSSFNTNNFTLARNGNNIEGAAADSVRTTNNEFAEIIYQGATLGWRILKGVTG